MHIMKKLILSSAVFTFRFATATHVQQVNTLLTKLLPESPAPGKEIQVITVNYAAGAVDAIPIPGTLLAREVPTFGEKRTM